MKNKIMMTMLLTVAMSASVLAGCGSGQTGAQQAEPAAAEETAAEGETTAPQQEEAAAVEEGADEGETTMIANPWSEVASAEEAAKGAGIDSFEVAEDLGLDLGENFGRTYRCMEGIAEVQLEFPASALTIRKGNPVEDGDISGDYNEYAYTWTQDIDGITVTCWGNREGDATKAIWSSGDMCFSMFAEGLGGDQDFGLNPERMEALVSNVK